MGRNNEKKLVHTLLLILTIMLYLYTFFHINTVSSNRNEHVFSYQSNYRYGYNIPNFVYKSISENIPEVIKNGIVLSYIVATEGIVLLKNNNVLPLHQNAKIAVFGRSQHWTWLYHSGGSAFVTISPEREVTLLEGLINAGFNVDKFVVDRYNSTSIDQMFPFTEQEIAEIAKRNDVAIIVISRFMSEALDIPNATHEMIIRYVPEGMWWGRKIVPVYGYNLTRAEKEMINIVSKYFDKTIVILNTGNAIDISWDNDRISAILWVGYPGEQGGNAIASILLGLVSPSGKLPFTWAKQYEDYSSAKYFGTAPNVTYFEDIYVGYRYFDTFGIEPKYPFGYGLSYTKFKIEVISVEVVDENVRIRVNVTNIGRYAGKEIVQIYVSCPEIKLEKPYQQLAAFAKTDLLQPGSSQLLEIVFNLRSLASYDEETSAWILELGNYIIRVGNSSRNTSVVAILTLPKTVIIEDTVNRLHAPLVTRLSKRRTGVKPYTYPGETLEIAKAPRISIDPTVFITTNVSNSIDLYPPEFTPIDTSDNLIKLRDVYRDDYSLKQLIAQMSIEEMTEIIIGLRGIEKYDIPELRHADGPNGLRDGPSPNPSGTAFPSANILAASWDIDLAKKIGEHIGREVLWADIVLWLAPGLNILRNPLQGRSGEYYSEDPIHAGVMGAAIVKGFQSIDGVGAAVKHFVGNEQEYERYIVNVIVSERALREIYLKPFEIVIKTAEPWSVMTSYNKINGIYTGNDPHLCIGILRIEWNFRGFVMTDWWSASYNYLAVLAGNDVLMPWDPLLGPETINAIIDAVNRGEITLGQLQRNVYNILKIAIKSRAFAKILNIDQKDLYRYTPPPDYIVVSKITIAEAGYFTIVETQQFTKTITETLTLQQQITRTITTPISIVETVVKTQIEKFTTISTTTTTMPIEITKSIEHTLTIEKPQTYTKTIMVKELDLQLLAGIIITIIVVLGVVITIVMRRRLSIESK